MEKTAAIAEKVSIIAGGMQITGNLSAEGDIRIDGTVKGNVFCKSKVVIISSGKVEGDIEALNVDVHGTITGNITAEDLLCLKASCNITGNLTTDKLQIDPNATFNGQCTMGASSKKKTVVSKNGMMLQEN